MNVNIPLPQEYTTDKKLFIKVDLKYIFFKFLKIFIFI